MATTRDVDHSGATTARSQARTKHPYLDWVERGRPESELAGKRVTHWRCLWCGAGGKVETREHTTEERITIFLAHDAIVRQHEQSIMCHLNRYTSQIQTGAKPIPK